MKRLLPLVFLLIACGGTPAPSVDQVSAALTGAGAQNVHEQAIEASAPVPHSFQSHLSFVIAPVAPRGGQAFICDTKKNCDAIYAYFDALKGLAGPYLYQSPSGTVVVQLNSGLTPDQAEPFSKAVSTLP